MFSKPWYGDYALTLDFGVKYPNILGLFGKTHEGIDFALPCGTPLISPANGTVTDVKHTLGGYGNHVYIKYGNVTVLFAHLSEYYVVKNQIITLGQVIGKSGRTGLATGCHVHIGVIDPNATYRKVKQWVDPKNYFNFTGQPVAPTTEAQGNYTVRRGDTLWGIAQKYYGKGTDWPRIYEANKTSIKDPSRIYPGQILIIPK